MTLTELHKALSDLPGHGDLVLEEYRIRQDVYDPGNDYAVYFYLTGPKTFYLYTEQTDEGYETTFEEYAANYSGAE
jgi:hypothetical protein